MRGTTVTAITNKPKIMLFEPKLVFAPETDYGGY